ncbi:MAG: hypothetical protein HZB68_02885, partial [Candidatus Aenigmarchaeota archaeon]|nr:hypothetical protein [Candidatus Aenigmarchaeota archaeon]
EKAFSKYSPSQYFAALIDGNTSEKTSVANSDSWIIDDEFIGVKGDERLIGKGIVVKSDGKWIELLRLQASITGAMKTVCRVFLLLEGKPGNGSGIILRAVDTQDFMTASPTQISLASQKKCAERIMGLGVSFVAYEITTKPPATIEII